MGLAKSREKNGILIKGSNKNTHTVKIEDDEINY